MQRWRLAWNISGTSAPRNHRPPPLVVRLAVCGRRKRRTFRTLRHTLRRDTVISSRPRSHDALTYGGHSPLLFFRFTLSLAARLISGPIFVRESSPSPTRMSLIRSAILATNSSKIPSWTMNRLGAMQTCPPKRNFAAIAPFTASSRLASLKTLRMGENARGKRQNHKSFSSACIRSPSKHCNQL